MNVLSSTLNGRHRVLICHSLKNLTHHQEHPHLWHIRKLGTRGARSPRATHLGGVGKGSCAVSGPELTSEFSLWVLSCCNGFFPDKQVLNSNKITLWCQEEKKNDCDSKPVRRESRLSLKQNGLLALFFSSFKSSLNSHPTIITLCPSSFASPLRTGPVCRLVRCHTVLSDAAPTPPSPQKQFWFTVGKGQIRWTECPERAASTC